MNILHRSRHEIVLDGALALLWLMIRKVRVQGKRFLKPFLEYFMFCIRSLQAFGSKVRFIISGKLRDGLIWRADHHGIGLAKERSLLGQEKEVMSCWEWYRRDCSSRASTELEFLRLFSFIRLVYVFRRKSRTGWLESRSEIAKICLTATSAHKVKIGEMHFIRSAIKKSAPSNNRRKSLLTIGNNRNDTGWNNYHLGNRSTSFVCRHDICNCVIFSFQA